MHESWDEPNSQFPDGQHDGPSLHYEGRAARVSVSTALLQNTATHISSENALLGRLTALAICAGFDYVSYNQTNYLQVTKSHSHLRLSFSLNSALPGVCEKIRWSGNGTDL